jgi:ferritin
VPSPAFVDLINAQIGHEYAASQQYVAVAIHYDSETLPRLRDHFYRQALEERNHAMMLVQYLLDRGHLPRSPPSRLRAAASPTSSSPSRSPSSRSAG